MKHIHTSGFIVSVTKTATACCGRRVKFSDLALLDDADCPDCRKHAEQQHAIVALYVREIEDRNSLDELRSEHLASLRNTAARGPVYRNVILA